MAWDDEKTDDEDILYASDYNTIVSQIKGRILHSLATAENDMLVASGAGAFVKKTLAEVKTILGLGSAAYLDVGTASGDVAAGNRGLPSGGTEGQIIKKVDGTNFNVTWGDPIDADALVYKGAINCSTNPNYPAADAGDTYKVSAAGKIGGASGPSVAVGDLIICSVNSTASGDHATVGSHWSVIGATTEGGVAGPTSSIDGNFPAFSGTSGGSIVDSGTGPSSFLQKTLATAANLFLVSSAANTWAVKTIAEIKTLLGLGGAAYLDVGTEAGSVCAGDDARLSDSRTPTSHGNEAHSSTFLTEIDIHGATPETAIADDDEILIYDASASANRRMTRANFLDGISASYTLPTASADTLGGVKIGDNLSIDGSGVLSAVASPYELPTASVDVKGGIKIGSRLTITDGVLSVDEQGGSLPSQTGNAGKFLTTDGTDASWSELPSTTFASGDAVVTLPENPSAGQVYQYVGTGTAWTINANTGQTIRNLSDTGNRLTSGHNYASVALICIGTDEWSIYSSYGTVNLVTV